MAAYGLLGPLSGALCVREDDQASPTLAEKPGRRSLCPSVGAFWLFPQSDQAVRLHHGHRGMFWN
jgi:hypothetical protein